jgi:transcriptional regulator with XRE-family HTH domain
MRSRMFHQFLSLPRVTHNRNDKLLKQFGLHLKKLRLNNGFSQETLAFEADIPISQIGRIERGEVNTTLSTLNLLSKALKIPMKELVDFS